MNKYRKLTIFFLLIAVTFIIGGMATKNQIDFSPLIGWIIGVILLFISSAFSLKAYKK